MNFKYASQPTSTTLKWDRIARARVWYFCSPGGRTDKESTCQHRRPGFDSWIRRIPWSRKWQPTPVFLPGKLHGQRSLVGYSPWGRRESDMTECTPCTQLIYTLIKPQQVRLWFNSFSEGQTLFQVISYWELCRCSLHWDCEGLCCMLGVTIQRCSGLFQNNSFYPPPAVSIRGEFSDTHHHQSLVEF